VLHPELQRRHALAEREVLRRVGGRNLNRLD
jgi:hypothetical protein